MNKRIQVIDDKNPSIGGNGENLQMYLSDVNSEFMRERIGLEKVVSVEGVITTTQGRIFSSREHRTQGGRYLCIIDGEIRGCINVTRINRNYVISNIYVRPDCRRQGIASMLFECAKAKHPNLKVDASLTEQGAHFFGYADLIPKVSSSRLKMN